MSTNSKWVCDKIRASQHCSERLFCCTWTELILLATCLRNHGMLCWVFPSHWFVLKALFLLLTCLYPHKSSWKVPSYQHNIVYHNSLLTWDFLILGSSFDEIFSMEIRMFILQMTSNHSYFGYRSSWRPSCSTRVSAQPSTSVSLWAV